jgi:hypothetical protein
MRGLKASDRMVAAGAAYVREAATGPGYQLWSVGDDYPAMLRVTDGTGGSIAVEIWSVTPAGLLRVYRGEPPELSIGWIDLNDGTRVLGVLGEPAVVEGQREITKCGGWRAYTEAEGIAG